MRGNLLADMATAPLQWFISYVFTIRPPQSTINVYKNNTRNTQTRSSLSNTNNWIREERETNSVSVIFSHNDLEYFHIYFHVHVALPLKPGWGSCKSHFTHYHSFLPFIKASKCSSTMLLLKILFLCLDPQYKLQHVDVIVTERQLLSSSPETNVFRRNLK